MLKLKSVKTSLIGKQMPRDDASRGVFIHNHFNHEGWPYNPKRGVDCPKYRVEFKSRRSNAVSPMTIGAIQFQDLVSVPYKQSLVAEKMQYQIRVTVDSESVVTAVDVLDFTPEYIQDMIEQGYDQVVLNAKKFINKGLPKTISGNKYCYAERIKGSDSYLMRLRPKGMQELITASKSTFNSVFNYDKNQGL